MTVSEYNQCVDNFSDNVYRFILKNIQDEAIAQDIVQDAFEKMWLKRSGIQAEKARSYLFTAAHHTMIDVIRKSKRKDDYSNSQDGNAFSSSQYSDLKEVLNEALEKLPTIQKQVVLLRDYEGYDYKEIGSITSLTESQVKVYIYRARVFLKNYIGSMEAVI